MNLPTVREHPILFEELIDYALGCATPEVEAQVRAHLDSGCARCQQDLAWLERLLQTTQCDIPPEPPAWVVHRARQLYSHWEIESVRWHERLLALLMAPRTVVGAVFLAAVAFLFLGGSFVWRAIPTAQQARLTRVVGGAEVWLPPQGPWRTAEMGTRLGAGARLRTHLAGTVELRFPNESRLALGGQGELEIRSLYTLTGVGPLVARLRQSHGRGAYQVMEGRPGGRFAVETPVATIEGRDARYDLEVQPDGTTTIWVLEGDVVVSAGEQKVTVRAGEQLVISPNAPAAPLQPSPIPATWTPTATPPPRQAAPPERIQPTPTPSPTFTVTSTPAPGGGRRPGRPTATLIRRPPTPTYTWTPTPTITPTPTQTLTPTPSLTPSRTPTFTPTSPPPTPRPPTPTPVPPSPTPVPPTDTPLPTDTPPPTDTPVPPTPTPVPPTATATPKIPTIVPPHPTVRPPV